MHCPLPLYHQGLDYLVLLLAHWGGLSSAQAFVALCNLLASQALQFECDEDLITTKLEVSFQLHFLVYLLLLLFSCLLYILRTAVVFLFLKRWLCFATIWRRKRFNWNVVKTLLPPNSSWVLNLFEVPDFLLRLCWLYFIFLRKWRTLFLTASVCCVLQPFVVDEDAMTTKLEVSFQFLFGTTFPYTWHCALMKEASPSFA